MYCIARWPLENGSSLAILNCSKKMDHFIIFRREKRNQYFMVGVCSLFGSVIFFISLARLFIDSTSGFSLSIRLQRIHQFKPYELFSPWEKYKLFIIVDFSHRLLLPLSGHLIYANSKRSNFTQPQNDTRIIGW